MDMSQVLIRTLSVSHLPKAGHSRQGAPVRGRLVLNMPGIDLTP